MGRPKIPALKVEFSESERREILQKIEDALVAGQLTHGPNVLEFERKFAEYIGARHAIAVNSGGAAIEVAMELFEVRGKEVIVPTNTFIATALGVLRAGGTVRLADISDRSFAISRNSLEQVVSEKTVGVIIVHIGGLVTSELPAISDWCRERGFWLFEDAAHACGSDLRGVRAGLFGFASAFSFFATKVVTSGEGGMLVTNDDAFAQAAREIRDYGKKQPWVTLSTRAGFNWRMPEFCAATGSVGMDGLEKAIEARQVIATIYDQELSGRPGVELIRQECRTNWYKYIVLLDPSINRDRLRRALEGDGISLSGGVYEIPLHRQPVFETLCKDSFPVADEIAKRHVCLPIFPSLTEREALYVAERVGKHITNEYGLDV